MLTGEIVGVNVHVKKPPKKLKTKKKWQKKHFRYFLIQKFKVLSLKCGRFH